jgi:hypothetical protein
VWSNTVANGELVYAGGDDVVSAPNIAAYNLTNATWVAWVSWTDSTSDFQGIVGKPWGTGASSPYVTWQLAFRNDLSLQFQYTETDGATLRSVQSTAGTVPTKTWMMVAASQTAGGQAVYLNDKVLATASYGTTLNTNQVTRIMLGSYYGTGLYGLNGRLGEVMVFNRNPTFLEMTNLYYLGRAAYYSTRDAGVTNFSRIEVQVFGGTRPRPIIDRVTIYATNAVAAEARVLDGSGNDTVFSPHEGETHIADSFNHFTGKGRRLDLDAVGIAMQALATGSNLSAVANILRQSGKTNIYHTYTVPKLDWDENETRQHEAVEQTRRTMMAEGRTNEAARLPVYVIRPKPLWLREAESGREVP